ncbi:MULTISPECIES: gephyrin-like molybdotransferase Glp [Rhodomicrobium]|uniref:molybdopterin molybdotransferase MoeA n=1 Tax=Rhodomicrobium TaxID=1068 RepID=UPI000B4BBC48|nr:MULTISPECIES: gephyrin-like molybdotransferase Glp [Rhodomicrobium]
MLSVAEALALVVAEANPLPAEDVPLAEAHERVLAEDLAARLTQPPFRSSAMDGYAARQADLTALPARLRLIGESAAGHPFHGQVGPGETVRIFTGAEVPDGADYIIIQENVSALGGSVDIHELSSGESIRAEGSDFSLGQVLLRAGKRLSARDLMLAAQMNHAVLPLRRRPRVAILASGDELVRPGETPGAGQIISSIPYALAAMLRKAGADPIPLGIARDTQQSLAEHIAAAGDADILVTIGGASVGDHDLVRGALESAGYGIAFHKVAIRPGKPLMSGARGRQRVIGLPGNPVSAAVCAQIFLLPLIAALLGENPISPTPAELPLAAPLPENGPRQHYMRARYVSRLAESAVEALGQQDSALVATLAAADCLIVRPPFAPAAHAGDFVQVLPL